MFLKLKITSPSIKRIACLEYFPLKCAFLSFPASQLGNKNIAPRLRMWGWSRGEPPLKPCASLCDLQQLGEENKAADLSR